MFYKKEKTFREQWRYVSEKVLGGKKILTVSLKLWEENFKKKLLRFFFSSHDFMMGISANLFVSWSWN